MNSPRNASNKRYESMRRKARHAAPASENEAGGQTAKLFMHGRSQAVRLPKEFRLPGKQVRVRHYGNGVLLEPLEFDLRAWFARLDALREEAGPFMPEGREQPAMPPDEPSDSFDQ